MVTGAGITVGLPTKKLARTPSKNKGAKLDANGEPKNTMRVRDALREMMEERASASNDRDPSREFLNEYWSQYIDEKSGEVVTSGEAIFDGICEWAETQGAHYKMKKKDKVTGETKEFEAYRPLRQDAIVAHEIAIITSVESWLRIPEDRREEFLRAGVEWLQSEYKVAAYAIHYDEGYKDEGEQFRQELEPLGLWSKGYVRKPHIQAVVLSVDKQGEFVGQHLFDKKGQSAKEKSFCEFMQKRGFDVVDNRNFKPERIEEETAKLVSQGLSEEEAAFKARGEEYARCYDSKKAKAKARNEYGVTIPKGSTRNQFGELSREQARRRLLDIEAQEDYRKERLEQYTESVTTQAQERYREIVDKGRLDASKIIHKAKEEAIDYQLQAQQMEMRAKARCEQMQQKAEDELHEAERKRKQAEAQAEENRRVSADLTAAITKYNEDKAALNRDRGELEEEKAKMREYIAAGQQARAEQLQSVNSYYEDEGRVKVAR